MHWDHGQHRAKGRAVHCSDSDLSQGASSLSLPFSSEATVSNLLCRLAKLFPTNLKDYPRWKPTGGICLWRQPHMCWQYCSAQSASSRTQGGGAKLQIRGPCSLLLNSAALPPCGPRGSLLCRLASNSLRNKDVKENWFHFLNLSTIQSNAVF